MTAFSQSANAIKQHLIEASRVEGTRDMVPIHAENAMVAMRVFCDAQRLYAECVLPLGANTMCANNATSAAGNARQLASIQCGSCNLDTSGLASATTCAAYLAGVNTTCANVDDCAGDLDGGCPDGACEHGYLDNCDAGCDRICVTYVVCGSCAAFVLILLWLVWIKRKKTLVRTKKPVTMTNIEIATPQA